MESYARLQEEQAKEINSIKEKIKQWEKFTADYEAVQERLQTLPKKLTHDIMVPFGSVAFMPGQLYHTNEVLVLLGDNWFTECTADHAWGIAERRKKYTIDKLHSEQKNLKDMMDRFTLTREVQETNKDFMEIREEYDPEQEKEWRKAHKKRLKDEKIKLNKKELLTHDDVWTRLEELEEQEKRDNERESTNDNNYQQQQQVTTDECEYPQQMDPTLEIPQKPQVQSIVFEHTNKNRSGNLDRIGDQDEHKTEDSAPCLYRTPGDIYQVPIDTTDRQTEQSTFIPKEISQVAKKTVKFSDSCEERTFDGKKNHNPNFKPSSTAAFTGHVIEHGTAVNAAAKELSIEPKTKMSKFKASKFKS